MYLEYSRQSFERSSNIKFHENLSSASRVVRCGRMHGQTDITSLIVTSPKIGSTPKKMGRDKRDYENILHGFLVKYAMRSTS